MSVSPVSSSPSSLSPTNDGIGRLKCVSLDESCCEVHPGYIIKNAVCKNCNGQFWIQKSITFNIGIGLVPWGKAPPMVKVNIGSYKYCAKCNANYKDSAIVCNTWSCCGKAKNSYGCSSNLIGDMQVDCCVDD